MSRRRRVSKSKRASAVLKSGIETPVFEQFAPNLSEAVPIDAGTMKGLIMKKKSNNYKIHHEFVDGSTVGSTPPPADLPPFDINAAEKKLQEKKLQLEKAKEVLAEEANPWNTAKISSSPGGFPDVDPFEQSYGNSSTYSNRDIASLKLPRKRIVKDVQATYTPIMGEPYSGKGFGEVSKSSTPADAEDFATLKEMLQVNRVNEQTHVFAIATNKENADENQISAIRCFGGIPFGGYVHDATRDSYLISCVSFLQVGSLPFSFLITMPSIGEWKVKVPIPVPIVEKSISPSQRAALEEWQKKYPTPKYEIYFLQMLGCH